MLIRLIVKYQMLKHSLQSVFKIKLPFQKIENNDKVLHSYTMNPSYKNNFSSTIIIIL